MKIRPLVRAVTMHDAPHVAAIYDYHARSGTASFDLEGLSLSATEGKISRITEQKWPFLIAEVDGAVAGYAYATRFRDRPGYAFTCENSIYVDRLALGRGFGKALLHSLCREAETFGFRQMLAVIGGGEEASVRVHASCGFEHVGRMRAVGWKNHRWLDTLYMQKPLGLGSSEPPHSS